MTSATTRSGGRTSAPATTNAGAGVEAVVPADGDAEQRRDRGERKQDRERPPLGLRRRVSCDGDGRRDDRGKGDDGGVGGR